jgi:hypothetical protein
LEAARIKAQASATAQRAASQQAHDDLKQFIAKTDTSAVVSEVYILLCMHNRLRVLPVFRV